jgi:hypothetical protein
MRYRLRTLLIVLAFLGSPLSAANPIDPYIPGTFSEQLEYYDAVVVVRFMAEVRGSLPRAISAEFEVIEVIKAVGVDVKKGDRIVAPYYDEKQGKNYLITGKRTTTARMNWKRSETLARILEK